MKTLIILSIILSPLAQANHLCISMMTALKSNQLVWADTYPEIGDESEFKTCKKALKTCYRMAKERQKIEGNITNCEIVFNETFDQSIDLSRPEIVGINELARGVQKGELSDLNEFYQVLKDIKR